LDSEGANLSCLDPQAYDHFTQMDQALYGMCHELEQMDEKRKLTTEKERQRNQSCLTYEAQGLQAKSLMETPLKPDEVLLGDALIKSRSSGEESTGRGGSRRDAFKGTLASFHADQTAIELQEGKNEELRLRLQIQQAKANANQAKANAKQQDAMMMMMMMHSKKNKKRKRRVQESSPSSSSSSETDDDEEDNQSNTFGTM